jgi:transposase
MSKKVRKDVKEVNNKTLIVSVDVGKYENYCYARTPNGEELESFKFIHSEFGYLMVYSLINSFRKQHNLDKILFGIESTGNYGETLVHYMLNRGIQVVQVNPFHTKKLKELTGNSPNKTDKKDPKVIADIMALKKYLTIVIPRGVVAELDRFIYIREDLLDNIRRAYNRLESAIVPLFPELLHIFKDIKIKTVSHLLRHYATPESIVELGLTALSEILYRISRGQFDKGKAEQLYLAASNSVGIKEGVSGSVIMINQLLDQLNFYQDQLSEIENIIKVKLHEVPYSKYILQLRGIGPNICAAIISEAGDLRKYSYAKQLQKLAGLNLYEISSGKHKGKRRISKRGRSLLRKMLYFAALNASKKGGILHDIYQKHLAKGMKKNQALTAISRKLITIIYAIVRDNSDYIENYREKKKAA